LLPIKIPLKLYGDVGTNADAWNKDDDQAHFLYDAGIQVSMLNELINFYIPLIYSPAYKEYFQSVPGNSFFQRISFSINIQDVSIRKLTKQFTQ